MLVNISVSDLCCCTIKVLSHGAIFLATCNPILATLGRCKFGKYMFPSQSPNIFLTFQTLSLIYIP